LRPKEKEDTQKTPSLSPKKKGGSSSNTPVHNTFFSLNFFVPQPAITAYKSQAVTLTCFAIFEQPTKENKHVFVDEELPKIAQHTPLLSLPRKRCLVAQNNNRWLAKREELVQCRVNVPIDLQVSGNTY